MINFVLERDVLLVARCVYVENLSEVNEGSFASLFDAYIENIKSLCVKGTFYKVEVGSVFVGIYIIDMLNRSVLFKDVRKSKLNFSEKIEELLDGYLSSNEIRLSVNSSFVINGG
jgi:hypothetical protein